MEMQTIGQVDEFYRTGIYGFPGTGKTTLAAGADKPVFLDWENSTEALRGRPEFKDIPIIKRNDLKDFEKVLRWVKSPPKEINTIVIDTASSMNDTFLMEHMRGITSRDRHTALFGDFRKMSNLLKEIFYELITVKKHVIVIMHTKVLRDTSETGNGRILEIRPQLPPAAEDSIEKLLNEIWYIETKPSLKGPSERVLHLDSQGKILAKSRTGITEATVKNPTWRNIRNGNQS